MKVYVCNICGYRYDESKEKVLWNDLPDDWKCLLCGVGKDQFTLLADSADSAGIEGKTDAGSEPAQEVSRKSTCRPPMGR